METRDPEAFEALLAAYGKRKHPLEYHSRYQLMVMVVLSARDSDRHINALAPRLFAAYPSLSDLAKASLVDLVSIVAEVTNGRTKAEWLLSTAKRIGSDDKIPSTLDELIAFPGIGRKSANVIIRESGASAEGIVVDLHVVRVAPRIGIASGQNPERIEKQLMAFFPQDRWNEVGMAFSFLGRELCRPSNPKCELCPVSSFCDYRSKL